MPRIVRLQASFTGGEIDPRLYVRADIQRYATSAREVTNFIVLPQGGVTRRPGTEFVAQAASTDCVLIPFAYATEQTYVIEATPGKFRFYTQGGRLEDPPGTPVEVATPYAAAELKQLRWAQSADELYIAHPSHAPRVLRRTSLTSFTLTLVQFRDGPYLPINVTSTTLAPSATTGNITITASTALFAPTDVGTDVSMTHGTVTGYATITAFTSPTQVSAVVRRAFGATTATTAWRLAAWGRDGQGWPSVVTFHDDRLVWAASVRRPQTVWASKVGLYETYTPGPEDDAALTFTINDDQVNAVRWLRSGRVLQCGTSSGPFVVRATNLDQPLTPSNLTARRATSAGCAADRALTLGSSTLYIDRFRRRIHDLGYSFEQDTFVSPEVTAVAEHLTEGLEQLVWQSEPWRCLWAIRAGGELMGITYLREQQVIGFHRHVIGGAEAGDRIVSIATITGGEADELWLAVQRTIEGTPRVYIEVMKRPYRTGGFGTAQHDDGAWYLDSALLYSGPPATTISGLSHLEGRTVSVLANDGTHPSRTVVSGSITLERPASRVLVGLPYVSRIETLPISIGSDESNTTLSRQQRIVRVAVYFHKTAGGAIGSGQSASGAALEAAFEHERRTTTSKRLVWRRAQNLMDLPVYPFSGYKEVVLDAPWNEEATLLIEQTDPLPMTVLGVVATVVVND